MPSDRNLLSLDASLAIPTCVLRFEGSRRQRPGRSDRPPGRLDRLGGQTAPPGRLDRPGWPHLLVESSASVLWLNRVTQWFSGEPLQTPRTRCSLRQSPLMTWLPHSPGSTLVLRLNQETVHNFVPLFSPPCGPHLLRWPSDPSNQAYLSSPHLEASPATAFHACSSPAPTPVNP
jgi:hypothetical protein